MCLKMMRLDLQDKNSGFLNLYSFSRNVFYTYRLNSRNIRDFYLQKG